MGRSVLLKLVCCGTDPAESALVRPAFFLDVPACPPSLGGIASFVQPEPSNQAPLLLPSTVAGDPGPEGTPGLKSGCYNPTSAAAASASSFRCLLDYPAVSPSHSRRPREMDAIEGLEHAGNHRRVGTVNHDQAGKGASFGDPHGPRNAILPRRRNSTSTA